MKVFISYSRDDEAAVRSLVDDLKSGHADVWLDEELRGGACMVDPDPSGNPRTRVVSV